LACHDELLAAGHRYAELFELQAAGYRLPHRESGLLQRLRAGYYCSAMPQWCVQACGKRVGVQFADEVR